MSNIPRKPNQTVKDAARVDTSIPDGVDWERFYAHGKRTPPFLKNVPDENLVRYFEQGIFKAGRAVDLGCGIGRNAIFLAKAGCRVDAIDLSKTAVEQGRLIAKQECVDVNFIIGSVFDAPVSDDHYDIAYDSGLFHHLKPHRRPDYLNLIRALLKQNGIFGMTCFDTTAGRPVDDREVYEEGKMPPGIGFSEDRLRDTLRDHFEILELQSMVVRPEESGRFGMAGLWTILMKPVAHT